MINPSNVANSVVSGLLNKRAVCHFISMVLLTETIFESKKVSWYIDKIRIIINYVLPVHSILNRKTIFLKKEMWSCFVNFDLIWQRFTCTYHISKLNCIMHTSVIDIDLLKLHLRKVKILCTFWFNNQVRWCDPIIIREKLKYNSISVSVLIFTGDKNHDYMYFNLMHIPVHHTKGRCPGATD